jgi:hypothetical protein
MGGGYVNNERLGLDGVNDVHQYGGRMALTWLPMDGLKVNFNTLLYRLESDDNAQVRLGYSKRIPRRTQSPGPACWKRSRCNRAPSVSPST